MSTKDKKRFKSIYFKGLGMGAADSIPGVSGGTIAFITGIYEEFIATLDLLKPKVLKILFKEGWKPFWTAINGAFLLPLALGIMTGVIAFSQLLKILLPTYKVLLWSFFFGLVAASIILVLKQIKQKAWWQIPLFLIGLATAYWVTELPMSGGNTALWYIYLSGAIAITAMILPGISGSFILLLMGVYTHVFDAISSMKVLTIATFIAGVASGILAFSKVLNYLFSKFHDAVVVILGGFILGSLNKLWPWQNVSSTYLDRHGVLKAFNFTKVGPETYEVVNNFESELGIAVKNPYLFGALLMMLLGFLLILLLNKFAPDNH